MYNSQYIYKLKGETQMYLLKNALFKVENTYWYGKLKGLNFEKEHPLTEKNIDEDQKSMTIEEYFNMRGIDKKYIDVLKKMYGADKIWIMKPTNIKDDRKYWKKRNEKCLSCTKKCKQSIIADIYYCRKYDEKE